MDLKKAMQRQADSYDEFDFLQFEKIAKYVAQRGRCKIRFYRGLDENGVRTSFMVAIPEDASLQR